MASRLVGAGANITVYNRSVAKTEPLRALGAAVARTPAEVTSTCDVVFAMLADPRAAEAVAVGGPDSAVAGIASRGSNASASTYVDCSTVDERTGVRVGDAVERSGGRFLAAPVSGGWRDAASGKLLFLCGGSRAAFDAACGPLGLDAMGHRRWLLGPGPRGGGAREADAADNDGQRRRLARGDDGDDESVRARRGERSRHLRRERDGEPPLRGEREAHAERGLRSELSGVPPTEGPRLALQLADELGVPMPISAAANGQYIRARQMGLGDKDFAAVRAAYDAEVLSDKESPEVDA